MKKVTKINPIKSILPTKKRVVAYARVSTDKEAQLESLHTQISYYSRFIQANPLWEYGGIYYDAYDIISLNKEKPLNIKGFGVWA